MFDHVLLGAKILGFGLAVAIRGPVAIGYVAVVASNVRFIVCSLGFEYNPEVTRYKEWKAEIKGPGKEPRKKLRNEGAVLFLYIFVLFEKLAAGQCNSNRHSDRKP